MLLVGHPPGTGSGPVGSAAPRVLTTLAAVAPSRYANPENLKSSGEISQTRQCRLGIFAERQPVCRREMSVFDKSVTPGDLTDPHHRRVGAKHRGTDQL